LSPEPDKAVAVIPWSRKIPAVIDRLELVAQRPSRSKSRELNLEVVMASRNECERSRARLQREMPISDDASLLGLQAQAAEYVRESRRRDALEPDELISAVIDAVARDYFQHVLRKNLRRGGSWRRASHTSPGTSSPVLAGFDDALRIRRHAWSAIIQGDRGRHPAKWRNNPSRRLLHVSQLKEEDVVTENRETGSLIGSDKVEGTAVYGADDTKIGLIERVMIDKMSGKVSYASWALVDSSGSGTITIPCLGNRWSMTPTLVDIGPV
jgi:PRC-barrel domain